MRFLNPGVLPWLWLALVPLALYLFRRKSRTVPVSTLLFFKSLAREHQESAWLRRLKRWVSLLLSLLLICGPVVAVGRMILSPAGTQARSVVVVVDVSASMGARDGAGESRLERAQALVRDRLAGLPESVPIALVAAGATPEIVHPKSTNRRDLLRSLAGLAVRPVADNAAAAWASAAAIAALETPAEVWWAAEAPPEDTGGAPSAVVRVDLPVGMDRPLNAGITAFSVSRMPLVHARYQAFVQVALNPGADGPRTAILEPRVAGLPVARRELALKPGETAGLTLDFAGSEEQILEVSLQLEGDALEADNRVVARLPAPKPLVVAWITSNPDPFTEIALQSLASAGELEVFKGGPAEWPPPRLPDVVVFDSWLPEVWPSEVPALVINPSGRSGPIRARPLDPPVPREEIRAVAEEHPVLFRLNPGRLALTQTAVLDAGGVLQPLWLAGDQAVLAVGEHGGHRVVVLACAPSLSEQLPLTTSYPLLLGNALYWCTEKSGAAGLPEVVASGSLLDSVTASLEWREWRDGRLGDPTAVPPPPTGMVVLDRLGLWRTTDGAREGATALVSRQETHLNDRNASGADSGAASAPPDATRPAAVAGETPSRGRFGFGLRGELTRWVIGLVLAALLLESWLYHRHAVN